MFHNIVSPVTLYKYVMVSDGIYSISTCWAVMEAEGENTGWHFIQASHVCYQTFKNK